ncbi:hypothetical protein AAG570_010085 [Ranatra chinensis]|uniref:Uncharacterized protein n=1 Tax=Ranatra chinensis TaxID=642074 RepID=A0ABD0Z7Q3_9HEMI
MFLPRRLPRLVTEGKSQYNSSVIIIHAETCSMNPSDINRIIVVGKDIPDVTNAVLTRRLNGFGLFKKSEEVLKAKNPELYELIQSLNDSAHVLRLRCPANPIRKKNLSCNDVDNRWLKRELYKKCKKTPMLMYSFATSLSQHLKCWMNGSPNVENMIVISDGSYGVPKGFFCSFPVETYKPGVWFINEKLTVLTINCEILKCQLREINKDYCLVDEIYTQEEHSYRYVPEPNCNEEDFNNLIYGPDDEEA